MHIIQYFLTDREGDITYTFDGGTIHKPVNAAERNRVSGFQGFKHGGGAFRFEPDDFCAGGKSLEIGTHTGTESATTHRHEEIIHVGEVFKYFQPDRSLSFDDPEIIEGGNKGHFIFFRELTGSYSTVIKGITHEFDLDFVIAKHFSLIDFLFGCNDGHKDHPFYIQFFTTEGKSLCMVPGTGADHSLLQLFGRQGTHHVVCSPEFIRAYHLQVFPLEVHFALVFFGQTGIQNKGRAFHHFLQPLLCRCKIHPGLIHG